MIGRRSFIRGLLGAALYIGASESFAFADNDAGQTIRMYNTHTREYISVAHRDAWGYIPEALERINHFLRCHYNNEVHPIDPALIDLLCKVDKEYGGGNVLQVISGYRSPAYNAILARHSSGVARSSMHMKGQAIDFTIPGTLNRNLFRTVRSLESGGAGIYPEFVHMDTGRVRYWGRV
jgi:uncharacterized protein YcbK (DUF882 family)